MNRLGILFVAGALIISAILVLLVYQYQKGKTPPPQEKTSEFILVTTRDVLKGEVLHDEDVTWAEHPIKTLPAFSIIQGVRSKEDFIGAMTKMPIASGQAITENMLLAKGSLSPLASLLKPGMRAYTLDIGLASALAGLIEPGDTVDIILTYTQNVSTASGGVDKEYASKTILTGLTVIAVDQALSTADIDSKHLRDDSKHITLEVTPHQAEILAVSRSMGTLSLSLTVPIQNTTPSDQQQPQTANILLLHGGERVEQSGSGSGE